MNGLCEHKNLPYLCMEMECLYAREERLAIMVIDGGLSEEEAQKAYREQIRSETPSPVTKPATRR